MLLSKRKIVVAVIALTIVLAFGFSACGGSKSGDVLRIGVDDTYPPMEFKNDKNETVGFDVDLGREIATRLGKKAEFISNDWAGIFQAVNVDKFDCIISSTSITDERLENYAMTKAYINNAQVIVVTPENDSIKEPKDLKDKKVGVQIETTADDSAKEFKQTIPFELKQYDQVIQPFSDMKAGRLDAIIVDEVVARYYVAQDTKSYKVTGARLTNEPIGICFSKKNAELRDKVNKIIDDMKADGTLKKLSEKWFEEDLTGNLE